jgi:thiol:disulfide interchange protein DsbD
MKLMVFRRFFWGLFQAAKPRACQAFIVVLLLGSASLATGKALGQGSAVVQYPEIRAELVAYAPQGIGPGKPLSLGLLLDHQPQWHTYWVNPGDSGLPTELQWTLPKGVQAGAIDWPVPKKIMIGALANLGYEGQVLLPVQVQLPKGFSAEADSFTVRLHASWLVCRQECIPQEGDFALAIPVRGSTNLHGALFEAAFQKRSAKFGGQIHSEFVREGLLLRLQGLPQGWHGKAIAAFPEVSSVFASPLLPDPQDQVAGSATVGEQSIAAATQRWDGDTWTAQLPFSPQRVGGPDKLAFVFSYGAHSVRATFDAPGKWPDAAVKTPDGLPAKQTLLPAENGETDIAPGASKLAFWGAVLAAFVGGLLLNLMPCVFPVLALKALGLASLQGTAQQRRAQALAYTGGVLLSMAILGALLLGLRAGGQALGWGFHLQSPVFIAVLATLFTLICLNLMDLLDVSRLVPGRLAGIRLQNPATDAALSGALAVAVASPCTAPFMGASLGLAMTLPGWQAMLIFVALGLGLALPYALVSNSAALARHLPKPGPWMEHLRRFMVFPMAATVIWLVWVLAHMAGLDVAAMLVALLLCLSMCFWALRLPGRAALGFGAVALIVSVLTGSIALRIALQANPPAPSEQGSAASNVWGNWSVQAEQDALASGRPVFVDFTAAWCITCQYNEQQVLSKPRVQQAFAEKKVVLLRADWTRRDTAISQALQQLGRSGVPVYVLQRPGKAPVLMSELLSTDELLAAIADI